MNLGIMWFGSGILFTSAFAVDSLSPQSSSSEAAMGFFVAAAICYALAGVLWGERKSGQRKLNDAANHGESKQ